MSLLWLLAQRDFKAKYRGSALGWAWSILQPLLMLVVYTFAFSVALTPHKVGGSHRTYALEIFSGLLLFNLFAECLNRSARLIASHPSYVKKVVFPLEILPLMILCTAFLQMLIGFGVWAVFYVVVHHALTPSLLLLPFVWLPLLLFVVGLNYFISATGVYIKDLFHVTALATTVLMFMTPIFYRITTIPEPYRGFLALNPLAHLVGLQQTLLLDDGHMDWSTWAVAMLVGVVFCALGCVYFERLKPGFADVL